MLGEECWEGKLGVEREEKEGGWVVRKMGRRTGSDTKARRGQKERHWGPI